jgi:hypothetical protein
MNIGNELSCTGMSIDIDRHIGNISYIYEWISTDERRSVDACIGHHRMMMRRRRMIVGG